MNKSSILYTERTSTTTQATEINNSGAVAYKETAEQSLAKLICVGFLDNKYYTQATEQLELVKKLSSECSEEFVAACALYTKKQHMKDMCVVLLALLRQRKSPYWKQIFPKVCDDGSSIRRFLKTIQTGQFGSKNLNYAGRKLIQSWFSSRRPIDVWNQSIGANPSLSAVMAMAHPSPKGDKQREAVYKLIRKGEHSEDLPEQIQTYYNWLKDTTQPIPRVPFERIKGEKLSEEQWQIFAQQMTWNQLRQNINNLEKKGVFNNQQVAETLAAKLANEQEIVKANLFPHEIYTSYLNVTNQRMRIGLQQALDYSLRNVPTLEGNVILSIDVSGSMGAKVNGNTEAPRAGVDHRLTCFQVASLMACAFLKKNPNSKVYTFDSSAREITSNLNPMDSLVTNVDRIGFSGSSTSIASSLQSVQGAKHKVDYFVMFSDDENNKQYINYGRSTEAHAAWKNIKRNNPNAKFVMIDLQGTSNTQLPTDPDVLYVSGFNNGMFEVIRNWSMLKETSFEKEIMKYASQGTGALERV